MPPEPHQTKTVLTATARDLAMFVALALAFRIVFWLLMPRVIDTADAIHYLTYAENLRTGDWRTLDPRITPLFPALTALLTFLVSDLEFAAGIVSLIAGTLTVVPVYALTNSLFGLSSARVASLAVCIWPWLADYSCRVAPEALALLLWIAAAHATIRAVREARPLPWQAFSYWFLLHLTRPEGTVFLIITPVVAMFAYEVIPLRTRARRVTTYAIAATIGLALFALAMRALTGEASVSGRVTDAEGLLRFVFVDRGLETAQAFTTLFTNVLPVMLGPYLLLFAGAGLFMSTADGHLQRFARGELLLVFLCLLQFGCAVISTYAEPRYLMTVIVVGAMYAARGMVLVSAQVSTARRLLKAAPVLGLVAIMLFGTVSTILPEHLGRIPREPREYKVVGEWMRDHLEPGLVFTRKPQIGYYAGMPSTGPAPSDSLEGAITRARDAGARYVVIDERYTAAMAPALRPLLDPANAPPSLRVLRADLSPYPNARVIVYELVAMPEQPQS